MLCFPIQQKLVCHCLDLTLKVSKSEIWRECVEWNCCRLRILSPKPKSADLSFLTLVTLRFLPFLSFPQNWLHLISGPGFPVIKDGRWERKMPEGDECVSVTLNLRRSPDQGKPTSQLSEMRLLWKGIVVFFSFWAILYFRPLLTSSRESR